METAADKPAPAPVKAEAKPEAAPPIPPPPPAWEGLATIIAPMNMSNPKAICRLRLVKR